MKIHASPNSAMRRYGKLGACVRPSVNEEIFGSVPSNAQVKSMEKSMSITDTQTTVKCPASARAVSASPKLETAAQDPNKKRRACERVSIQPPNIQLPAASHKTKTSRRIGEGMSVVVPKTITSARPQRGRLAFQCHLNLLMACIACLVFRSMQNPLIDYGTNIFSRNLFFSYLGGRMYGSKSHMMLVFAFDGDFRGCLVNKINGRVWQIAIVNFLVCLLYGRLERIVCNFYAMKVFIHASQ